MTDATRVPAHEYCYNEVCGNSDQCSYHEGYNRGVDTIADALVKAQKALEITGHDWLSYHARCCHQDSRLVREAMGLL